MRLAIRAKPCGTGIPSHAVARLLFRAENRYVPDKSPVRRLAGVEIVRGRAHRKEDAMSTATAANLDPKHNVQSVRQAFYDKISKQDLAPLWEVLRNVVTKEPKSKASPKLWKYDEVKKLHPRGRRTDHPRGGRAPGSGPGESRRCAARAASPTPCSPASSSSCRVRSRTRTSTSPRQSASCWTARAPTQLSRARRPTCRAATSS